MARRKPISRLIGASPIVDGEVRSTGVISTGEASGSIGTFDINNSLRFDGSGDYLIDTFGSPTDNKVWTFSGWFKRASIGSRQQLFNTVTSDGSNQLYSEFRPDNTIRIQDYTTGGSSNWLLITDTAFTDTSSWYHIVFVFDSENSSAKIYVNGSEATYSTENQPSSNASSFGNSNGVEHIIGAFKTTSGSPLNVFNGQMAEVHFIDGTAYDASYFGETRDGVWLPKEVTGLTYGNNGFYLDFSQPSSTTNAFDSITWTGTDDATFSIDYLPFTPDLVWAKSRTQSKQHQILDSVRGNQAVLFASATDTETNVQTSSTNGGLKSIDTNGFTIEKGTGSPGNDSLSGAGENIVAWCWKAGGSSNTYNIDDVGYATASAAGLDVGSITPTGASVNTETGFSIIGYEGNETSGATVAHGLNQTPELIMVKTRDLASRNWYVGSSYLTSYNKFLYLNTTNSELSSTATFNDTAPTSSVFTLGNSDGTNASSSMIAYCWHSVEGYSKIGSYVGNSSSNGPIIKTGFRPAFIMIKNTTTGSIDDWHILDNARDFANPISYRLKANLSAIESSTDPGVAFLADGFQLLDTSGARNTSNNTYIYMAFADTSPDFGVDRTTDGTGVILLLDGSSPTTDLSSVENTITNDTGVSVTNITGPYDSTQDVLSFDGTSDTLTFDIDSTMQLAGDFTVESWVKRASTGGGGSDRECLWSYWGDGTDGARCSIQFERNTDKVSFYDNANHLDFDISNTNAFVDDTWFHIAIVRSGSTYECFVDGVSLGTNTGTTDTFTGGTSQSNKARIGALSSGVISFVGEIADFRITKGYARYTNTFTPPTSALSADVSGITGSDDVVLLLDGVTATDKSSANTGLNNTGVAVNQNSQSHPYASGALLFNGTDDLTITTENDNLYLGTEDWTIEGWFRTTNLGTTNTILEYRTSGSDNGAGKMFIGVLSNGQVGIYENTAYQAQSATGAITTNTWYHLAFQRSGGTVSVFINGSLADSGSLSSSTVNILRPSSRPIIGGFTGGGYNWIGEWVDFRITKGAALYPFHPPISALTNDDTWDKPKNNFSVEGNITPDDQLLDTPNLRFASLDASDLSDANLTTRNLGTNTGVRANSYGQKSSGKWYWETCLVDAAPSGNHTGVWDISETMGTNYIGQTSGSWGLYLGQGGTDPRVRHNGTYTEPSGVTVFASGDIISIAIDLDSGKMWYGKNDVWFGSGNPSAGTNDAYDVGTNPTKALNYIFRTLAPADIQRDTMTYNFGQDHTFAGAKPALLTPYSDANGNGEFYYEPPSGFLALAEIDKAKINTVQRWNGLIGNSVARRTTGGKVIEHSGIITTSEAYQSKL